MGIKEVEALVAEMNQDLSDRMDNILAIKGEKFAKAVTLSVKQFSLLNTLLTAPRNIGEEVGPALAADLTAHAFDLAGLTFEESMEAQKLASGITASLLSMQDRAALALKS